MLLVYFSNVHTGNFNRQIPMELLSLIVLVAEELTRISFSLIALNFCRAVPVCQA